MKNLYLSLVAYISLSLLSINVSADVVIIVNPDSSVESLTKQQITDIFLSKAKSFPDGSLAVPVDLSEDNEAREIFIKSVLNRRQSQIRAYWSDLIFTGKGSPPKKVDFPEDVLDLVANNPNIVGYLDEDEIDDSVKVVYRVNQ